jgi:hypothetical protein
MKKRRATCTSVATTILLIYYCLLVATNQAAVVAVNGFTIAMTSRATSATLKSRTSGKVIPTSQPRRTARTAIRAATSVDIPFADNDDDYHSSSKKNSSSLVSAGIFNLIKAILGTGLLALPSGLATITDRKET